MTSMRYILVIIVLSITALTQTKPGEATLTLYYPGSTPTETLHLPQLLIRVQGSCVAYTHQGNDTVFCGTFKLVKAK